MRLTSVALTKTRGAALALLLGGWLSSLNGCRRAEPPEPPSAGAATAVNSASGYRTIEREAAPSTPEAVVTTYYRRIAAHDYAGAWALWGDEGGRSGHTLAAFEQGFADTASTRVTITGAIESEGAAGSTYATVPVSVEARTTGGGRRRFTGRYVIRRVNDVPGATAAQLAWHIDSADLKPAP